MHHLHDGPPRDVYLPLGPRHLPPAPKKKPAASLAALQWATERAGQSYGRFILNLTEGEQGRIQEQYEAWKDGEKRVSIEAAQQAAQTSQPCVDNSAAGEVFIITDEDV